MPINWNAEVIGPLMGVFGEPVTYMPLTGLPFQIAGVYDKAFFAVNVETGSLVSTSQPTLGVQLSQFPSNYLPQQGDQLLIVGTGEQWEVREVHSDGKGGARLMLNVPGQTDV
ncbi:MULTISPECIES: hypothetical protein [unclassified Paraburkholderia]|uniref:head-tail joining protein n=1 Tax=unclassified Paraburkholderia TaxID=2615204 RepID=UPI00161E577A|nr:MULTISPECIES: hypothetical protein [unclassified Paraburkholderia]MBB5444647.1 hypothetical protein [Paraburkholderia sp. WSM4177]MBB5485472.1 hypothetical protein [Paraburkholderia sp. WSM4180]